MKTNINTDNYEAYLLDYLEGNLSHDEAEQLKAFVASQGLDWNELTQPLPYMEAPNIVYEDKSKLRSLSLSKGRSKGTIIPLYVKIASAAAAAGLLLTVTLWPEKKLPKVEPIATLKPILPERLITKEETHALPAKTIAFKQACNTKKAKPATTKPAIQTREELPLLATLQPIQASALPETTNADTPDFELMAYRLSTEYPTFGFEDNKMAESFEDEQELSLIGKGIYRLTNGRHDSFASLISSGLSTAKKELRLAATDAALTAYYRADERFEEARQRWEERKEE